MRNHHSDVIDRAIDVLDEYGLPSLTMRRLATELGVQPSALYHHVPNKQTLLTEIADEIVRRGRRTSTARQWDQRVVEICAELRDTMLAHRDGAEVVVTAHTYGLGTDEPTDRIRAALRDGGLAAELVEVSARALLHLVFGHTMAEQTAAQAAAAGAATPASSQQAEFDRGLELLLDGIRVKANTADRG